MKESAIQRQITDLLSAEGLLWFRNNVAAMNLSYQGKARFVRFGQAGMADLVAYVPKVDRQQLVWWLEIKAEKGQQSELQRHFQMSVESFGHYYTICRGSDDVVKFLGFLRSQ